MAFGLVEVLFLLPACNISVVYSAWNVALFVVHIKILLCMLVTKQKNKDSPESLWRNLKNKAVGMKLVLYTYTHTQVFYTEWLASE